MGKKVVFLPYDFDTAIGINNEAELVFSYNLEDTDTLGGAEVFNGQDSVLWKNIRDAFGDELKAMYQRLRSEGRLSYSKVEQMFEEHQQRWPEAVFNEDSWFTYLQPLVEDGNAAFLSMLQGSKESQRKWWLYNRFRYIDSKYNAGDALTDAITLRGYAKADITVTPYADIYATVKYGSYLVSIRATRNQSYTIACPLDSMNDTEIYIYSSSQLASVGDISPLKVGYADFSNATRLQSLKVGDASDSFQNSNMIDLYLGNNVLLETIDARNCINLGGSRNTGGIIVASKTPTIDLSGCVGLKNIYFDNTSIKGVNIANGAPVEVLHLPGTITNLTLQNLAVITDFTCPSVANVTTLRIENCSTAIDPLSILDSISANSRVRIIGFDVEAESYEEIDEFYNKLDVMRGLDESGNTIEISDGGAQVSGTIHIESLTGSQYAALQERYPYITIDARHTSATLTYKTYDGSSIIDTETILDGGNGTKANNTARASTAQYNFTPNGWATVPNGDKNANALIGVRGDRTVYAAYSKTTRVYNVTFVRSSNDGGGTLYTQYNVPYGTVPSYGGSTPTTTQGNSTDFPFKGWSPALSAVNGSNLTYTAVFGSPIERVWRNDLTWSDIITAKENGTIRDTLKLGNIIPLTIGSEGAVGAQVVGFDVDDKADGSGKASVSFVTYYLFNTSERWNPSLNGNTVGTGTIGGYGSSEIKTYVDGLLQGFPSELKNAIVSVNKACPGYSDSSTAHTYTETLKLFIPSYNEIFSSASSAGQPSYNSIFNNTTNRTKNKVSATSGDHWWLRSANSARYAHYVSSSGYNYINYVSNSIALAVGFCI